MSFYYPNVGSTVEVGELESLAKGAIIVGDGSGPPTTLSAGTDGYKLKANSGTTTGLEWVVDNAGTGDMTKAVYDSNDDGIIAIAQGGTGSSSASAARTALGLEIGVNVQGYDAELAALAGLTSASDKLPYFNGAGTATTMDFTAAGRAILDDADNTAQRATLGLTIGTNVQAFDATLSALAAYNTDGIVCQTAADTFAGRTMSQPAAGLTITNPGGVAGNPTFALANDLSALEGLASTGYAVRTASDTWAQRTLTGTANQVSITNGDGTVGNPVFSLPQSIDTSALVRFAQIGLGVAANASYDVNLHTGGNIGVNGANAKKTIVLSAAGGWGSTTTGATGPTKTESATNKQNIQTLDFGDTGAKVYAEWGVIMPDSWDGSTITAKFIWTANSTSTNSVVWGLQARAYADTDTIDQAFGSAVEVSDANQSTAYKVSISSATSAITIGGSPAGGQYVHFRCYRDSNNASDTLAVTANLIAIQIKYGVSTFSD